MASKNEFVAIVQFADVDQIATVRRPRRPARFAGPVRELPAQSARDVELPEDEAPTLGGGRENEPLTVGMPVRLPVAALSRGDRGRTFSRRVVEPQFRVSLPLGDVDDCAGAGVQSGRVCRVCLIRQPCRRAAARRDAPQALEQRQVHAAVGRHVRGYVRAFGDRQLRCGADAGEQQQDGRPSPPDRVVHGIRSLNRSRAA